jgi:hypothetical protein
MEKANSQRVALRRIAFRCAAVLAALLGTVLLTVALAVYRPALIRPLVERALTPRGGSASLAGLSIALRPPGFSLEGLVIAGPPREGDILRLDLLRVELAPGRLFRGDPWVRSVEAQGLVFERPRPRKAEGPLDLTPLARLFDIEDLSLTDARLRLALPQGEIAAEGLSVSLAPGEGGIRIFRGDGTLTFRRNGSSLAEGTLTARGQVAPGPAIEADLELTPARLDLPWLAGEAVGRAALRVTRKELQAEDVSLAMPRARLRPGPRAPWSLDPIHLSAAGSVTLDGKEPRLELRVLDVGSLLRARGLLSGPTLEHLTGTAEGEIPRVDRAKALLDFFIPGRLKGLGLEGELPFRLKLAARGTERVLDVELLPRDLPFSWPEAGLQGRFGGALTASSPLQEWLQARAGLGGRLRGTGRLERPPLAARMFRFDLPLAGELAALTLPGGRLSAGAGDVLFDGRPLPLGALEVRGNVEAAAGIFRVEGLDILSETLGRLRGALAFRGEGPAGILEGRGLSAGALLSLAGVLAGRNWADWSPGGAVDVAARIDSVEGVSRVAATVALENIAFSSTGGDVMAQGLAGRLGLEARLGPRPRLEADLEMGRGEALWGTVYVDLARDPLDLHGELTRAGPGEYRDLRVEGRWAAFGRASLEGEARREGEGWRHEGRLALSEAQLGPVFRTFLREPLAATHPVLAGLEMDGTARLDLSFAGSEERADLEGRLRLHSGDIRREGEPPVLSGLDVDLPIAYSLGAPDPGAPRPAEAAAWGRLRLVALRLAGQEMGPVDVPVTLVPNRLYLDGNFEASPYGARLLLQRIRVDEPLSSDFRVDLAARLEGLDLARLAGEGPALEGTLGGVLDPVRIGRERLTAAGDLIGEFFGGRMAVGGLTAERPFSPGREIGADVIVHGLDLERLSAALNIGRITGRLEGIAEGLRIAYGQPVAFRLRMESMPVRGVSQRVSLQAVDTISVLGTGATLSGLGFTLMTTFFREFAYAKIGIACNLENDVFTVQGLIHQDGVEYLVKRPLFAGIDVINRNPDNRIGFSDMMERLRRVTAEGPR